MVRMKHVSGGSVEALSSVLRRGVASGHHDDIHGQRVPLVRRSAAAALAPVGIELCHITAVAAGAREEKARRVARGQSGEHVRDGGIDDERQRGAAEPQ